MVLRPRYAPTRCVISRYRVHAWVRVVLPRVFICVCAQAASIRDITDRPRVSVREIPRSRLSLNVRTLFWIPEVRDRITRRTAEFHREIVVSHIPATVKINDFSSTIRYQKSR